MMNAANMLLLTAKKFRLSKIPGLEIFADAKNLPSLYQDSAKTTPVTAGGQPVGAWSDSSGNGIDFLQSVSAARPVYNIDKDGCPFIRTDGIQQFLNATVTARSNRSYFIVLRRPNPRQRYQGVAFGVHSAAQLQVSVIDTGLGWGWHASQVPASEVNLGGETFIDPVCISFILNGTDDLKIFINGIQSASFDPFNVWGSTSMQLGASAGSGWGRYDIRAFVAYNRTLTPSERTKVENYLKSRYRAAVTPPMWSTIWESRQTVLSASIPADEDNLQEPALIYDTNPQILTGEASVFKMWFTQGWTNPNTCYAESVDGISWTRQAGYAIANSWRNSIVKNGATYYLYNTDKVGGGAGKLCIYTSPDGVNWTSISKTQLPGMTNSFVFLDDDSIWKCLWEKDIAGSYTIQLATSPDGLVWTNYGTVIDRTPNSISGPHVYKVGGVYYYWGHLGVEGKLPTDIVRMKSTDLINWTEIGNNQWGYILRRETADEGLAAATIDYGQAADPCVVHFGNKIYLFYTASASGSVQTGLMHIKLATCPDEWLTRET